jgi:hypothetical protein
VIERIIEDWLINVNERQYQLPFCQLLEAEGETIVYISTHGQMEQGKDIISVCDKGTEIRAYQLKAGRLNLSAWRKIRSEIVELVEYPIEHPSLKSKKHHTSFLVTNGTAADTVINAIKSENKSWRRRRCGQLQLITSNELVARFVKAHGRYLPNTPENFALFVDLLGKTGTAPLDKEMFSTFLETVLPLNLKRPVFREIQRAIASAVLLTTYIVQRSEHARNHWAIFEAWVMLGAYILALQQKYELPDQWWTGSFDLTEMAAVQALENLYKECKHNEQMFTQGSPLIDGYFYRARITILIGLLSSLSFYYRLKINSWDGHEFIRDFIQWYRPYIKLWGESGVPYLLLGTIVLEQSGDHTMACRLIASMIDSICKANGSKGNGTASPYYGPEAALRPQVGLGRPISESFTGHAYTVEPLILWAARRGMRLQLEQLWPSITRIHFVHFTPAEKWEYFRWRARSGVLHTKIPDAPQSWAKLVQEAYLPPRFIPSALLAKPEFAAFFALVFPQRISSELLNMIDFTANRHE